MKKPIIILSLFLSSIFIVSGQQWDSLQSGVINSYSTGYHYGIVSAQTIYIATWNGINWSPVGNGINDWVFALCVYDSALCAGGQFYTAGNIQASSIAYWNGRAWGTFGSGIVAGATSCLSLYSFNSVLYAGGRFPSAGGIPCNSIAQWTGGVLGINNVAEGNRAMSVYPNPSKGAFTLVIASEAKQSPSILEVYNVLGEKVYTSTLPPPGGGGVSPTYLINLSSQPNGVYLYRVITETGELVGEGKVIIQK